MKNDIKLLIIAGTEKSGTTSLYQYLVDTNYFTTSVKKETDYLRQPECNIEEYLNANFEKVKGNTDTYLEASPGYLADSIIVSQNIKKLGLQNQNYVLIIRSPLERLISNFIFRKSRLYIKESVTFDEYVEKSISYEKGTPLAELGMTEWCMRALDGGLYHKHIQHFKNIGIKNILVFEFKNFATNPQAVMNVIKNKFNLNYSLPENYSFEKSNVTFSAKNSIIQKFALFTNRKLESFFYKHPKVKHKILDFYKKINSKDKEKITIKKETLEILHSYYKSDIKKLCSDGYITQETKDLWLKDFQ
ncbi:sulfotransferase domain-containing protein [Alteromonas gilva]|uniref:Sulfotransferase domain-containing protein n=1 Tax=Alteromonas gilva TaxID=2987522 RepID=A0ABT5KXQ6_9ALTE|nr:sulfotransferase domain-containing protein [Alteromonas gilva]MDC8829555.1 sulfotransferase domain-containing protein [Alteromonas gilva]